MTPLPILLHAGAPHPSGPGAGPVAADVGSTLYDVPAEHVPALLALAALPLVACLLRALAPRWRPAARLVHGYRSAAPLHRLAAWLLAASGVVHLALIGHHHGPLGVLVTLDGAAQLGLAVWLMLGRRWRLAAVLVLGASVVGWWLVALTGESVDQLAILTKLVEVCAIGIALTPTSGARLGTLLASAAVVTLVVLTDVAAWAGGFAGSGAGHHAGAMPPPGTLLPAGHDRVPTPAERAVADGLWLATKVALARYADPRAAAAAGYDLSGVHGTDFHARNEAYADDGRILDPARPEYLIYAVGADGPVLLGAMFEMPMGAGPGPAVGGPLTVWHGHEQVCLGLLPAGLTGLASPWGGCPVGSIDIARTPEMIHVWTAPGAPVHWGELDDAWRLGYLASLRP